MRHMIIVLLMGFVGKIHTHKTNWCYMQMTKVIFPFL